MSVLDSAYFTTETLTTVGFGDFYFANQHGWLRVWAIALMILGATLVTVLYAMLTNLLVSRRIAQSLGRQLATRMTRPRHRGRARLGRAAGARAAGRRGPAASSCSSATRTTASWPGPARSTSRSCSATRPSPASLDAVDLRRARAVAVLTSSDLANIETGLVVDDLLGERRDDVPVVLRVFDRDLAEHRRGRLRLPHVRSTAALAAPWFVGAALGLDILTTFYVDQPADAHRPADGRRRRRPAPARRWPSCRPASGSSPSAGARRAARLEYPPRRDTRFAGGDQAYLVGPYEELLQVLRRDAAG